jgi:hypothetical protein
MNDRVWHRGTAVELQPGLTVDQQLAAARLDWDIKLADLEFSVDGQRKRPKGQKVAYRADTGEFIDTYKKRQVWQNRQIVEVFNQFCDNAKIPMTHLGYLNDKNQVFCAALLAEHTRNRSSIDKNQSYLMLQNGHRNGDGLQVWIYSNRLICVNGQTHAVTNAQDVTQFIKGKAIGGVNDRRVKDRLKVINHVGSFNASTVTSVLEQARTTDAIHEEIADRLTDVAITKEEAHLNLIKAFGDVNAPIHEQPKVVQTCMRLFLGEGAGSSELTAYNTAFGLMESLKEYYNWQTTSSEKTFSSILNGNRASSIAKFQRQLVSCYC